MENKERVGLVWPALEDCQGQKGEAKFQESWGTWSWVYDVMWA